MRIMSFVVVLLLALIAFSWFTLHYLQTTSDKILAEISLCEAQIKAETWPDVQTSIKNITSRWDRVKSNWKVVLDHRETDEIGLILGRLQSFTFVEDQGEALAELYALRFLLEHIPKKEQLLLRNIF